MKKWPSLKCCYSPGRMIYLLGSRRRRCCWAQKYVPMMGSKLLGPKKAKKLRIIAYLNQLSYEHNYDIRVLVAHPLLLFQVACICCRNAYTRVHDAFLRVLVSP